MLSPYCRTTIITDTSLSFPHIVYVFKACFSPHFASWWNHKPEVRLTGQGERTHDSPRKARLWLNRKQQLPLTRSTLFYRADNRHSCLGLPWEGSNLLTLTQSFSPLKFLQFLGLEFFFLFSFSSCAMMLSNSLLATQLGTYAHLSMRPLYLYMFNDCTLWDCHFYHRFLY